MSLEDKIEIIKGDIAESSAEAIVNAANTELVLGSGVAGAIRNEGGACIQAECNHIGPIALGEAAVTGAGELNAKYVIHAAGMRPGGQVSTESLRSSTLNSLLRAREIGVRTIAFPAIGTGVGGYPVGECALVMLDLCLEFLESDPGSFEIIYFILFDNDTYTIFEDTLQRLTNK